MNTESKSHRSFKRYLLPLLILIAGLAGTGFFYLKFKKEKVTYQTSLESRAIEYQHELQSKTQIIESESAKLFGQALGWAVRKSMIRKNLDEVDQYVFDLVQNEPIEEVLVLDKTLLIVNASEKKYEGKLWTVHPRTFELINTEQKLIFLDSMLVISVPMHGPTEYIGHVIVFSDRLSK